MKSIKQLLCGVAVLLAASCAKEKVTAPAAGEGITQITASWGDEKSKSVLGEDGVSVLWSPNDEISVFFNKVGVKFTALNDENVAWTIFSSSTALVYGGTELSEKPYLYAVYPYSSDNAQSGDVLTLTVPASQTAVDGSFARGSYPSVARSMNTDFAFYNVCGGVRFTLCQSGIRKIVLSGKNNETLAGKVKVQFDENNHPVVSAVVEGEKSITLTAPDGGEFETGKWYYISVLPVAFSSEGLSFEFIRSTDLGTRTIASAKEIKRSLFGSVENIDSGVEFNAGVISLSISPAEVLIAPMSIAQLSLTVLPEGVKYEWIKWTTSDKTVATVDEDGMIVGKKNGTCVVTATSDNGRSASCKVTVSDKIVKVTGVALDKTSLKMQEGQEQTLTATVTPEDATDKSVAWSSSNEAVVSVSEQGVVKALHRGSATVTATTTDGSFKASCEVTVEGDMAALTGEASHISLNAAKISGQAVLPEETGTDLEFGVLYSTNSGVLIGSAAKVKATDFDAQMNFVVSTEVLEPSTTYYYRSYIAQGTKVTYGEVKSFETLAVADVIKTLDATNINPKDATLNASLNLTDCKYESLEYGFKVTPEGGSTASCKSDNLKDNVFSIVKDELTKDTKYSYCAYVKFDGKTFKGETKEFTTASIQASVTAESSDIKYSTATISGKLSVTSEGSFTKSAKVYYSTTANTLEALKSNGTKQTLSLASDGSYTTSLSSLKSETKYYYAVMSKVDDKEFITEVKSFTTLTIQASVTAESSDIKYSTATISGKLSITSEGTFTKSATLYYSTTANTMEALKSNGTKQTLSLASDGSYTTSLSSLKSETKYYYVVVSTVDDKEFASSVKSFSTKSLPEGPVDMGLSVKWASCNIGASKPEKYGRYFAWGDVKGQTWDGSSWSGGSFSSSPDYEVDSNNNLKPAYDAAHVILGGKWRMPTKAEQQELKDNCTSEWTTYNGVYGRLFTSKKTGYTDKSIFLPAAGYGYDGGLDDAGSRGYYWSSTFYDDHRAWYLFFYSVNVGTSLHNRYYGQSVRPVSE